MPQVSQSIKRAVRRVLCLPPVNAIARGLLRRGPLAWIVPRSLVRRIPVSGRIRLPLARGKVLRLRPDGSDFVATRVYWDGLDGYEGQTLRLYLQLLRAAGVVMDVGAHTGLFALIAAIDDCDRTVYAFEPVSRISAHLTRAVQLNGLANLEVDGSAVTDHVGEVELYIPVHDTVLPTDASTRAGFRDRTQAVRIPAVTIDAFVSGHAIGRVDLIKIDTEATEHLVLAGAAETLSRDEPMVICEVLYGETEDRLHALLDGRGYRYYWISTRGLIPMERIQGDPTYQDMNYLFITDKRVQELRERGVELHTVHASHGQPVAHN